MESKNEIVMNYVKNHCDSVDDEINSIIIHLQTLVCTIMKFHQEQKTEELKSFCKKNNYMINFILKMEHGSLNMERKNGFEIAVRPYITG